MRNTRKDARSSAQSLEVSGQGVQLAVPGNMQSMQNIFQFVLGMMQQQGQQTASGPLLTFANQEQQGNMRQLREQPNRQHGGGLPNYSLRGFAALGDEAAHGSAEPAGAEGEQPEEITLADESAALLGVADRAAAYSCLKKKASCSCKGKIKGKGKGKGRAKG